jgi:hypothetical protein
MGRRLQIKRPQPEIRIQSPEVSQYRRSFMNTQYKGTKILLLTCRCYRLQRYLNMSFFKLLKLNCISCQNRRHSAPVPLGPIGHLQHHAIVTKEKHLCINSALSNNENLRLPFRLRFLPDRFPDCEIRIDSSIDLQIHRVNHRDFEGMVVSLKALLERAMGQVIANLSGGPREIFLAFTIACLSRAGKILF